MGWFSKPSSQLNFFAQREKERLEAVNKALQGPFGDNATLYSNTKALLEAAQLPDPTTFCKRVGRRFIQRCDERGIALPHHDLGFQMFGAAAALYAAERLTDLPPNPAAYSNFGDTAVIGQMRDLLLNAQRKLAIPDKTLDLLENAIVDCSSSLPPACLHSHMRERTRPDEAIMIPLIDLLPNVGQIIEDALAPFEVPEVKEAGLFRWLREHIKENTDAATAGAKKSVTPSQYKATPQEIVATFLKDTSLSDIFLANVPVYPSSGATFRWTLDCRAIGRGKTTLLHAMIKDDLAATPQSSSWTARATSSTRSKSSHPSKTGLLLIEPNPDSAFALNPLDVSHAKRHAGRQPHRIHHGRAAGREIHRVAIHAVPQRRSRHHRSDPEPDARYLQGSDGEGPARALDKVNPHARQFFENRETGFHSKTYESTRKEVVWRLDYLLTNPILRSMFSATHTKLDIGKEMDAGKVIIINNSKAILGDEGAEFFGRFFVALIARAAQQRAGKPPASKKPCYVYIDECQSVIAKDTRIPILLDECRSQKIALDTRATNEPPSSTPPVLDAVANCAIRMANSDDEAKYLVRQAAHGRRDAALAAARHVRHLRPRSDPQRHSAASLQDRLRRAAENDRRGAGGDPRAHANAISLHSSGSPSLEPPAAKHLPLRPRRPAAKLSRPQSDDPGEPATDWA